MSSNKASGRRVKWFREGVSTVRVRPGGSRVGRPRSRLPCQASGSGGGQLAFADRKWTSASSPANDSPPTSPPRAIEDEHHRGPPLWPSPIPSSMPSALTASRGVRRANHLDAIGHEE